MDISHGYQHGILLFIIGCRIDMRPVHHILIGIIKKISQLDLMHNLSIFPVQFQDQVLGMFFQAVSRCQNVAARCLFLHGVMGPVFYEIGSSHPSEIIHIIHLDRMGIGERRSRNFPFHK